MRASKKIVFVVLTALVAFFMLSAFTNAVNAQTNFTFQASLSTSNHGVNEEASYTFTISNTGTANLGNATITIPTGYVNVKNLAITQQPPSQSWNITTQDNSIFLAGPDQGLATGQNIVLNFDVQNPQTAGTYSWKVGATNSTSAEVLNSSELTVDVTILITSILPALAVFGIALGIAFLNSGLNRVLINFFIGWEQYRVMQKEMSEFRAESMAAARASDKKQMEKLKKKQSQINSMQAKMMKPQMVQFGISFVYLIVWFLVLTPTFQNTSMAYVPGFGPISVFYIYPIFSLFLGLISSRIIGIMPIENR